MVYVKNLKPRKILIVITFWQNMLCSNGKNSAFHFVIMEFVKRLTERFSSPSRNMFYNIIL